ncbi:hypothetical protein NAT02_13435 [Aeromonas hydrophila]|uniref:hypothetical protein n=1 Tax=Aeromonas hydrophila TaxID=644 RepID=UPI001A23AD72|nr:hypothetical protein [Aeromonas hydrophila]MCP3243861.1 hypothetical protein [Aeromonas hydrophila]HAU4897893.1 hypothetical protein [Aeromonas hydrophila]
MADIPMITMTAKAGHRKPSVRPFPINHSIMGRPIDVQSAGLNATQQGRIRGVGELTEDIFGEHK